MPVVEFEGQSYDFPEGTTDEEMLEFVDSSLQVEEVTPTEDKQEPFAEEAIIKKDEGVRKDKDGSHVSYKDSKGLLTGGRGHQLNEEELKLYPKGTVIPDTVVKEWFKTDIKEADDILTGILEEKAVHVPDEVYSILLNMTFNLGGEGIKEFKHMWAAIQIGDWESTAQAMLDSKWAKQVGNRAVRLSNRMANIQSDIPKEEVTAVNDNLVPSKGGLFKDSETGTLFVIDEVGNKTEV